MSQKRTPLDIFQATTGKSRALYDKACRYLEGGTTRTSIYYQPYPFYAERGEGYWIYDVDGNKRLDFLNNFSSLIHGHVYPKITEAVRKQLEKGTAPGAPTEHEAKLAQIIMKRIPSIGKMRFCSSGSEAVMFCLRLAKAFTGRNKIAKFEGGFHGSHEYVQISIKPPLDKAGNSQNPFPVPFSAGISAHVLSDVIVMPFNYFEATEQIIEDNKDDIAAVIVEPIQGAAGVIPARGDFLKRLRAITEKYDIVLIFDEIMTIRTAWGGAQEFYSVTPDLTTMGKVISGGFPLAAFGGREDIMALLDPRKREPSIPHSGTFNAIPVCVVAGIAAMEDFTPPMYEELNRLADRLCTGANNLFRELGIKAQVTQGGSLFNIHFTDREILNYRDVACADRNLSKQLHFSLLNRGINIAERGYGCISTPMTENEIDMFLEVLRSSLVEDLKLA